jgi:hypothetical protein
MRANAVDFKNSSVGVVDFIKPELVPVLMVMNHAKSAMPGAGASMMILLLLFLQKQNLVDGCRRGLKRETKGEVSGHANSKGGKHGCRQHRQHAQQRRH